MRLRRGSRREQSNLALLSVIALAVIMAMPHMTDTNDDISAPQTIADSPRCDMGDFDYWQDLGLQVAGRDCRVKALNAFRDHMKRAFELVPMSSCIADLKAEFCQRVVDEVSRHDAELAEEIRSRWYTWWEGGSLN